MKDPSRRTFLKGLGTAAAISPFVPLLNAGGQEMRFPKRLVLFYTPDGRGNSNWQPSGSGTTYTPGAIHVPLERHRSEILILGGMRLTVGGAGEGHAFGMSGLWTASRCNEGSLFDGGNMAMTGWGSGTSVDQVVARAYGPGKPYLQPVDAATPETRYRTLELGAQSGGEHIVSRMIYAGDSAPIAPDANPYSAFDRLFGGFTPGAPSEMDPVQMGRRSVLDLVSGELESLQRHGASTPERPKIDAHLEAIRSIERRLQVGSGASCEVPTLGDRIDIDANDNFPAVARLQMDLLTRALSCDLTRVASIQLSRGFSPVQHRWIGLTDGHHVLSHRPSPDANMAIDTWYAEQFAYFLDQLRSVPEGGGTLLDNTLVVWGHEVGMASGHSEHPASFVLAGRAGGTVSPGRYTNYGDAGHHQLLVRVCNAMGLDEVTQFGNLNTEARALSL